VAGADQTSPSCRCQRRGEAGVPRRFPRAVPIERSSWSQPVWSVACKSAACGPRRRLRDELRDNHGGQRWIPLDVCSECLQVVVVVGAAKRPEYLALQARGRWFEPSCAHRRRGLRRSEPVKNLFGDLGPFSEVEHAAHTRGVRPAEIRGAGEGVLRRRRSRVPPLREGPSPARGGGWA
jgi:hypothetical protein